MDMVSNFAASVFGVLSVVAINAVLRRRGKPERLSLARVESALQRVKRGPIAHRGGVPENTITGFRIAKEHGASAIEVDLQLTKDGHPILIHDYSVDRTSDGQGNVADLTLKQIKELDVGAKFGYPGETVPTLYEALDLVNELDLNMFLELKSIDAKTLRVIKELFSRDQSLYNRVFVISFFPNVIAKLKYTDPNIMMGLVVRSTIFSTTPDGVRRYPQSWKVNLARVAENMLYWFMTSIIKVISVDMVLPHKGDILSGRFQYEKYRRNGMAIVTWTVNNIGEKRQFQEILNIPYMTDNVKN